MECNAHESWAQKVVQCAKGLIFTTNMLNKYLTDQNKSSIKDPSKESECRVDGVECRK